MARRLTSPEMVGRAAELASLGDAFSSARVGRPRHVVVVGEAGVGKTRLLERAAALARADGARVLTGACFQVGDAGLPFAPYAGIVRALVAEAGAAQVAALAGRSAVDLGHLVPAIAPGDGAPAQELWAQSRLHEALLELLRRLSARAPLLLQLEDLHWADAGTLAATSFLVRALLDEPISIEATIRSDELGRGHPVRAWLAELARSDRVERLDLAPLGAADVRQLVNAITGHEPTLVQAEQMARRSDGNPFFVEELLASGADLAGPLSPTLRDVLLDRVDGLPDSARTLLAVAATGGREVEYEALVGVAGATVPDADACLRALVEAGLLVPVAADDRDLYAFRHALLQEAVHENLLPTERRRLHRDWAEALERTGPPDPRDVTRLVALAHHWREARDRRALGASIEAGDAAMRGFAVDVAWVEYQHALSLWDPGSEETRVWPVGVASAGSAAGLPVEPVDRAELLRRAGRAAYLAADYRHAEAATREAIEELGAGADPSRRSELAVQLGRVLWVAGDWSDAISAYEEAVREAPEGPSPARIRALAGLGQVHMLHGHYGRSVALCEEAIALARSIGARDVEGHALNTLATCRAGMGAGPSALADIEAALAIAIEQDLPDDIGRAFVNRGDIVEHLGYSDRALDGTLEGIEEMEARGAGASYGVFLRLNGVGFAFECGRWDVARRLLLEADRMADPSPGTAVYRAEYGLSFLVATGAAEAEATWSWARERLAASPPSFAAGFVHVAGVELLTRSGRLHEAVQAADEGFAQLAQTEAWQAVVRLALAASWSAVELAIMARARGDRTDEADARARLERYRALATRARSSPEGERAVAVQEQRMRHIAAERARDDGVGVVAAWRGVADGWAELGWPYLRAYALWRLAEAEAGSGDAAGAEAALRDAHAIAEGLGARPMLADLEALARRLRVRLGSGPREPRPADTSAGSPFGLTRREREVLALVADGLTNRQVAEALFISESTAGVHVSNILGKLGVATRTEAARVALTQGLAGRPAP